MRTTTETYKYVVRTNFLDHFESKKALHHVEMMKHFLTEDAPKYQVTALDELIEEYKEKVIEEILLVD